MMAEIMVAWSTLPTSRRFLLVVSLKLSALMVMKLLVSYDPTTDFRNGIIGAK